MSKRARSESSSGFIRQVSTELAAMPTRLTRGTGYKRPYKRASTLKKGYGLPKKYAYGVKKICERVTHRNLENKTIRIGSLGNSISSYNISQNLFTVSLLPYGNLLQGTGQGDRIGNVIRTKKCMFNFVLRPMPYNSTSNTLPIPQEVILFIGKVKNSKPFQPTNTDYAKLFQNGDGVSAPQSNLTDLCSEVNSDWFTVLKRMTFKVGYGAYTGLGNQTNPQFFANNDYKLNVVQSLDITALMPKVFRFNDNTQQPTNDGLWCWATSVNSDGSTAYTPAQTIPVNMDFFITYIYEDA